MAATRLTSAEKKELAEFRREKRRLELEDEILKRAAAFFAGRSVLPKSYRLVRELAADGIDVAVACQVLNVSRSGYYDWCSRPISPREQENELLLKHIKQIHAESRCTYGWPRVHPELTLGLGLPVNRKRVARLMRQAGIQGLYRRRRRGCTVREPAAEPGVDLVNRRFTVDAPNRLWIIDITEHPTGEGRLYCAAVMDAYSRLIIGWSLAGHMRTELVTDALGMAVLRRQPDNQHGDEPTILHSDLGAQYTSWAFGLGRSLRHLIDTIGALQEKGIGFKSLQEQIDTTTSGGKLVFHVFGALAEFERDLIRERTQAGLQAARARGRLGGRPRALDTKKMQIAQALYNDKSNSIADICRTLRISRATLYRYVATGTGKLT